MFLKCGLAWRLPLGSRVPCKRFISYTFPRPNSKLAHPKELFTEEGRAKAREERIKGLGPYVSKLPEKLIPYAELMRLEKPVGTWLLYMPCTWSITVAAMQTGAPITSTLTMLGLFGAGAIFARGAGCTINDLLDRNLDNKVIRSVERPLASGRVTPTQAKIFFVFQTALSAGVLLMLPSSCFWLGFASFPIVCTYPLFKRFTYYPQVALSSCFAWGALLGFPAMGVMDVPTMIPLYLSSFLWCMTYDTIYAHQDKVFDKSAGIKSTALKWGKHSKKIMQGMSVAQVGMLYLAAFNGGFLAGPGFIAGSAIFTYRLFNMIRKVNLNDPKDCWRAFLSNINSGLYLTAALFFDFLLGSFGLI
ncbi:HHL214Cp [Eremothecium sinecaudum]|uniref:4-hydroxybenzoate polyprenyltransferase, mitochondrial n=1 Tax=Eremothecium sinecaudum TaxID=45286 RepID=A0A0X8HVM1_9SACH|nr:HHL214Cp [Eremothecium sinecaudum]AMD22556.1 HHL214Cp [Eremothecium sinecaudum]